MSKKLSMLERFMMAVQLEKVVDTQLDGEHNIQLGDVRAIEVARTALKSRYEVIFGRGSVVSVDYAPDVQIAQTFRHVLETELKFMQDANQLLHRLVGEFPTEITNVMLLREMLKLRGKDTGTLDMRIETLVSDPQLGGQYRQRLDVLNKSYAKLEQKYFF